jgi:hypothetical protein
MSPAAVNQILTTSEPPTSHQHPDWQLRLAQAGLDLLDVSSRNRRLFYQAFPKCDALRHELNWTRSCLLLRVDASRLRQWAA